MKIAWVFVVAFGFWLSACNVCSTKQYTCPAFDSTAFKGWFPYQKGQVLRFKNIATGVVFSDTIEQKDFSQSYMSSSSVVSSASCNQSAYISSDSFRIYYSAGFAPPSGELTNFMLDLGLYNSQLYAGQITADSIKVPVANQSQILHLNNFRVADGTQVYPRVEAIELATGFSSRMQKVWVAKGVGIVGYLLLNGELWVKD